MPLAAVSEKTFGREVLGAAIPVLVEFSAEHAPSHAALDDLSNEMAGTIKVVRVDVGQHPTLKDEYGVRGLPTHILFKFGKPVSRRLGGLSSKAELREWIAGALILALATRRISIARSATHFKMANGMEVVVIPDHRAPVVTHMVWFRVGAADDPKDFSGISRLVEHLTFKSLDRITDGDFSKTILRLGGQADAFIYRDATVFWQSVPGDQLKMAMESEVDRMINLHVTDDEVASERGVILEQRRSEMANDPGARLVHEMNAALYRAHPYGRPVFGLPSELARLSREDVQRFHKLHYAPNKAILVVSGDVTSEEVKQLAHETFGRIPANPNVAQRPRLKEPPQIAARRVTLEATHSKTARFYRTYSLPGSATAARGETEALEVLAKILARGITSRLYRKLVIEDKISTSVTGNYLGNTLEAAELELMALATDGDLSAIEAGVDEVIEDIRKNGVTQEELACAKRSLVAGYIYGSADQFTLSQRYGWAAALGLTIKDAEDRPAAISRVSAADIAKVATKYLIARRSVTGWLCCRREGRNARPIQASAAARRHI
ncbi:insulinase family protein [Hyphomicrobium sp. NDB2Meth4]|uniref:insulinase family protein n=1 Tax=Hyphomicrobium sp. NDB2Meth4 TaxID=1892846 RepID=UPI000B2EA8E9|nr:insulinase family protein [Hyphomicrobium sp. NDB2Meth4]